MTKSPRETLDRKIKQISDDILVLGSMVEQVVLKALEALKRQDVVLAQNIYNADGVDYSALANRKIRQFEQQGWGKLPINMAKTHLSLSHDPNWKGVPSNYMFPIRDIRPSIGAGFLYPIAGEMRTMPGLPSRPAAVDVDIDETGKTVGLF